MPRRKRTPEEIARKERTKALMKELDIKNMDDIQDLFKSFVAAALEGGLEAELDEELGYSKYDYRNKETNNSRNGYSKKTMKTSFGDMDIDIPRDRNGDFEPKLIQKHQTTLSGDIEEKIISMYAKGMTENDIAAHIEEIYGLDVSDSTISRVTDKILPIAKEWQSRPLEEVYAVVFMDAIHYHVRYEGRIVKKAVYIAIGINLDGRKDVLGMWVGENESAKFWLSVLNGYKDIKALMADLKSVYADVDEDTALQELDRFDEIWGGKYPKLADNWRDKWVHLSTYFKYPQAVRTLIYTTNTIEGFNRQLRKVTKNKGVFPTDDSLFKMLYLAMMDITKKWTGRRRDWGEIHSQLEIFFADRISY